MDEPVASFQGFGDELKVKLFFSLLEAFRQRGPPEQRKSKIEKSNEPEPRPASTELLSAWRRRY